MRSLSPTLPDTLAVERGIPRSVRKSLALLSAREEVVVRLSYGLGGEARDLAAIADAIGLSLGEARRLRGRALRKLRFHAGAARRPASS